jgi:hypothetical protein
MNFPRAAFVATLLFSLPAQAAPAGQTANPDDETVQEIEDIFDRDLGVSESDAGGPDRLVTVDVNPVDIWTTGSRWLTCRSLRQDMQDLRELITWLESQEEADDWRDAIDGFQANYDDAMDHYYDSGCHEVFGPPM